MYNSVIKLVKQVATVNECGDMVNQETVRTVFAEAKSIGQKEFYEAAAVGLKPEIKFEIADFLDYQGEKILRYEPFSQNTAEHPGTGELQYDVLRTYRTGLKLEIVCTRGVDRQ